MYPITRQIADFRKDNGTAIRKVCAQFIALCRAMGPLTQASVAIDGSKFKAVNNRDKNFTRAKMERRMAQIEESVARYLEQLDTADRQEPSEALQTKTNRLKEDRGAEGADAASQRVQGGEACHPDQQISLTDPDARSMATSGRGSGVVGYNVQIAVEANHHLIVMHEVTNDGTDRWQLSPCCQRDQGGAGRGEARCRRRPHASVSLPTAFRHPDIDFLSVTLLTVSTLCRVVSPEDG